MKQTAFRVLTLLTALLILLSGTVTAFAGGGNGDGTGGGKDKPLELASSSIANGAQNVSQNPEIVLTFTKNVVHFTVRDNNKTCFSMTDSSGKAVPINVLMGDDQVDPSIKRIVTIKPQSSLTPGETYLLKIGGGITSKSGVSIGKDSYIAFTVADEAPTTTKPITTKPTTTKPATTKPTTTKPTTTKPTTTKPTTTKPTTTKPTTTKPTTTKPTTTQPTTTIAVTLTSAEATAVRVDTTAAADTETVLAATMFAQQAQEVEIEISAPENETEEPADELQTTETEAPETTPASAAPTTAPTTAAQKDTKTNGQNPIPYIITGGIIMIALIAVVLFIEKKK